MTRVLVLYGTSEGHTEKIATVVANTLIEMGCDASVIQAGTVDPDIANYDGVIVAASIHGGRFQPAIVDCVSRHAAEISARPNALVEVCLSVLNKDDPAVAAKLEGIAGDFAKETSWRPAIVKRVAGAMPYTRFSLLMRWLVKPLIGEAGGATDTSRDYVYTDWDDLKSFSREFGRRVTTAAALQPLS
jgi:menaquinone-dependent protoporphyrinogen oxidase